MKYPNKSLEKKLLEQGYQYIAGIDEAGRGALAGPIVAAAVIIDVKKCRIKAKDSKLLSFAQRENLYKEITKECLDFAVGSIPAPVIDKIGISGANRQAMIKAIENLKVKPDFLLIDFLKIPTPIPCLNIIDGDYKIFSIAAASIIAKVTRDRILISSRKKYPDFSFDCHKGYGTKGHLAEICRYGPSDFHRKSFAPLRFME